jgi:hypothetical protein
LFLCAHLKWLTIDHTNNIPGHFKANKSYIVEVLWKSSEYCYDVTVWNNSTTPQDCFKIGDIAAQHAQNGKSSRVTAPKGSKARRPARLGCQITGQNVTASLVIQTITTDVMQLKPQERKHFWSQIVPKRNAHR